MWEAFYMFWDAFWDQFFCEKNPVFLAWCSQNTAQFRRKSGLEDKPSGINSEHNFFSKNFTFLPHPREFFLSPMAYKFLYGIFLDRNNILYDWPPVQVPSVRWNWSQVLRHRQFRENVDQPKIKGAPGAGNLYGNWSDRKDSEESNTPKLR